MDNNQIHAASGLNHVIEESLQEAMVDIFDERNEYLTEEACEFIMCLEELSKCDNEETKNMLESVLQSSREQLEELSETQIPINQLLNIKSNMSSDAHITGNQPLPDVQVFSTLYDKGYIKDSYMQKHVATQLQTLRATALDLMGKDRVGRALRPNAPRVLASDWIGYQSAINWNNKLIEGSLEYLPTIEALLKDLLPPLNWVEQSIVDGTYEDLSVNTLMSYTFATIAALIVKQESDKLPNYKTTIDELVSFRTKFGSNGFFVMCAMAVNLAYAIRLAADDNVATRDLLVYQNTARTFDRWARDERNQTILLPSKSVYPKELTSLLLRLQTMYGFSISEEIPYWGISVPISMRDLYNETKQERPSGNMLEESREIGLGLTEVDHSEFVVDGNSKALVEANETCLDSLTERFQVESECAESASNPFEQLSVIQIHRTIMEHQNRLLNNALRYDRDALKTSLAENLLMLEWIRPMLEHGRGLNVGEMILLRDDVGQMDFQNKKYIDVVETDSMESLHAYALENCESLTIGVREIINGL